MKNRFKMLAASAKCGWLAWLLAMSGDSVALAADMPGMQAAANGYVWTYTLLEGDMENGYVSVGHAISFIHEIKPAAQIIADMTQDWGN